MLAVIQVILVLVLMLISHVALCITTHHDCITARLASNVSHIAAAMRSLHPGSGCDGVTLPEGALHQALPCPCRLFLYAVAALLRAWDTAPVLFGNGTQTPVSDRPVTPERLHLPRCLGRIDRVYARQGYCLQAVVPDREHDLAN